MARTTLSLSHDEILVARQCGGLTFAPRAGNRVVCNQAIRLGHITSGQADSLRAQVWPKRRAKPAPPPTQNFRKRERPLDTSWIEQRVREIRATEKLGDEYFSRFG
jgi:hypothetical protein